MIRERGGIKTNQVIHCFKADLKSRFKSPEYPSQQQEEQQNKYLYGAHGGRDQRNRAHTLVAHHQVCQTLKENKSKVSRETGDHGKARAASQIAPYSLYTLLDDQSPMSPCQISALYRE